MAWTKTHACFQFAASERTTSFPHTQLLEWYSIHPCMLQSGKSEEEKRLLNKGWYYAPQRSVFAPKLVYIHLLTNFIGFRNGGLECYITNPREAVDFRQSDSWFWASSCKNMEETQPIHIIPGLPVSCLSGGYLHPLLDVLGGIPPPPPPFHQFRGYLCVQSCQPFTSLELILKTLFWM